MPMLMSMRSIVRLAVGCLVVVWLIKLGTVFLAAGFTAAAILAYAF
jgi:hypothetical protein